MKAEEVRLNNLIFDRYGDIVEVTEIRDSVAYKSINGWILNAECATPFTPIPITHDRLIQCGFEQMRRLYHIGSIVLYFNNDGETLKLWHYSDKVTIQYVHELQNLVFALTKEELDVTNLI